MNTSEHNLVTDFFTPLLTGSVTYDRGVGYFTSGWLQKNAPGMAAFAANGGNARWITSPIMSTADWHALATGPANARETSVRDYALAAVEKLRQELENDPRNVLSWMISDGLLDMRLAVPRGDLDGDFHDKFGIFTDADGCRVSFNGSYNDSIKGMHNYESIKIFDGTVSHELASLATDDELRFKRLWNNDDPNVEVFTIGAAVREQLEELKGASARPYRRTSQGATDVEERLRIPTGVELRDYQKEAMQAWANAGGKGILKMATGTGKTYTALAGATAVANQFRAERKPLTVIIVVPYMHLVDQWCTDMMSFGADPIRCYDSRANWLPSVTRRINALRAGSRFLATIVVTNATFRLPPFQKILAELPGDGLLIVDEAHNAGAPDFISKMPEKIRLRLGLSATPESAYDDSRDEALFDYLGHPVFNYGLKEALDAGHLCPYRYHPVCVPLTPNEQVEYRDLTSKLARIGRFTDEDSPDLDEGVKKLLIKRARLVANAENKIPELSRILAAEKLLESRHILVYCGDGSVEDATTESVERNVSAVAKMLTRELGMSATRYVAETSRATREDILHDFANGDLQCIVAIRCLDEGVDVPATQYAFLLASSANPRQFIQRRGRVLRNFEGKGRAEIYDFIAIPSAPPENDAEFNIDRKLIRSELKRMTEFARLAQNGPQAEKSLQGLQRQYNLRDM